MPLPLKVIMGGLVAIIVAVPVLLLVGAKDAAWWLGEGGTLVWLLGGLAYAAIWDSKKRWPDVSTFTRYARIVTFYRD